MKSICQRLSVFDYSGIKAGNSLEHDFNSNSTEGIQHLILNTKYLKSPYIFRTTYFDFDFFTKIL